ncbi:MAG: ferritin family protein [Candidatus Bathyarchaeia archaeon]
MPLTEVNRKSLANTLSKLLVDEESSWGFYEIVANAVMDEDLREKMLDMAQSEREHAKAVISILSHISGSDEVKHDVLVAELAQHIEAEKRTAKKYKGLLNYDLDLSTKQNLDKIANESKLHLEMLKVVLNVMKSQRKKAASARKEQS